MIIELCKGGPRDGCIFEVDSDEIPMEWRAPSQCSKEKKEIVYRPRTNEIIDGETVKFDFAGYEDSLLEINAQ